jgi:hypothetical protein
MALAIPIISSFNDKGLKQAERGFKDLQTNGERAQFALKKGAQAAGIALAGLGVAAGVAGGFMLSAAKSAMEDAKSQRELAASIRSVTKATDPQIQAIEKYIDATQRQFGISDDKLRPALARIVRSTKDVAVAQGVLTTAIRVSTATGKPLEAVANALSKSYDGQNTALQKLGLGFDQAELKAMSFEQVQAKLDKRFAGAAADAANSFEGKVARLKITFDELKESAGNKILPVLTKVADAGLRIADAFGEGGASKALQQFKQELEQVLYDADGTLNAAGQTIRLLISAANLLGTVGQNIGGIAGGFKAVATGNFGYTAKVDTQLIENFPTRVTPRSNITRPGAMQAGVPGAVTINITTGVGDPAAIGKSVVDSLQAYQKRIGKLPIQVK